MTGQFANGTPVPDKCLVIRMGNRPERSKLSPAALDKIDAGKALPEFFQLSSEDKKQDVPRLSVWVLGLTSVAQAWVLVGANDRRICVMQLAVDQVRKVYAPESNGNPPSPNLDVEWEQAMRRLIDGTYVKETRPGWEGHAGITGLDFGTKIQREAIRLALADLAELRMMSEAELVEARQLQTSQLPSTPEQSE
jgi:hypothetical protein